MLVTFCHDRDLDFEQIDQRQMLVVRVEVMEEVAEGLVAYMYQPLLLVVAVV
jgi:hypothetical protein